MIKRFSVGQALSEGFQMPMRRPLTVLVWGLLLMLISAAILGILMPMLVSIPVSSGADRENMDDFLASMTGFQVAANGLNLIQLVLALLIWTAAMRALLSPARSDRWMFLRVSMDELRVAVVMMAIMLGLYFGIIVLSLAGVALGFALYALGEMVMVLSIFGFVAVVLVIILGLWSRVSIMAPASVILNTFAFVEGWRMGKGQTGRLILLNLAVWLIYMLAYIVVGAVILAILAGGFFASNCVWPQDPQTIGEVMTAIKPMTAWIILAFVPLTLFSGWAIAFVSGSLTSAARQLSEVASAHDGTVTSVQIN